MNVGGPSLIGRGDSGAGGGVASSLSSSSSSRLASTDLSSCQTDNTSEQGRPGGSPHPEGDFLPCSSRLHGESRRRLPQSLHQPSPSLVFVTQKLSSERNPSVHERRSPRRLSLDAPGEKREKEEKGEGWSRVMMVMRQSAGRERQEASLTRGGLYTGREEEFEGTTGNPRSSSATTATRAGHHRRASPLLCEDVHSSDGFSPFSSLSRDLHTSPTRGCLAPLDRLAGVDREGGSSPDYREHREGITAEGGGGLHSNSRASREGEVSATFGEGRYGEREEDTQGGGGGGRMQYAFHGDGCHYNNDSTTIGRVAGVETAGGRGVGAGGGAGRFLCDHRGGEEEEAEVYVEGVRSSSRDDDGGEMQRGRRRDDGKMAYHIVGGERGGSEDPRKGRSSSPSVYDREDEGEEGFGPERNRRGARDGEKVRGGYYPGITNSSSSREEGALNDHPQNNAEVFNTPLLPRGGGGGEGVDVVRGGGEVEQQQALPLLGPSPVTGGGEAT